MDAFFSTFLLWPWLLPGAALLSGAVAYFNDRPRRSFYLCAGAIWLVVATVLFLTTGKDVVFTLVATTCLFGPMLLASLLLGPARPSRLSASLVVLGVGVAFIPVAAIVAILTECLIGGSCM